ncbi:MAG TPA: glycoside hydrolase family 3 N-terminal domain-containing protein [Candidatus Acidoferrales bacterium]|nr:glycoside hydrolase family 3 N-terminal domain-containing protein [Candidatus Acidoferrales bacterium]
MSKRSKVPRIALALILATFLPMSPPAKAQKKPAAKASVSRADDQWAAATLKKMTLEEKLGQLVMVYYWGRFTSTDSPEYQDLLREVRENRVGGIILQAKRTPMGVERSQVYPSAALANQLQRAAKFPLLVAADFETGTAMRLADGTAFPSAMAVGATGDPRDAYTVGKVTALEARAAGLNWILAPVADVNDNPDNPIINFRSFGEDPQRVAQFVAQFIRGVQENGALATAKHFPGHGDVNTDSHLGLPLVAGDLAELERVELVPFRVAIAAGVGSVMSGHLAIPALEPDPNVPATISRRVLTDLLGKKLGFGGIVVTDALDMGGVVTTIDSPPDIAVRAVEAGADVLLIPPSTDAALAALKQAVESGALPMTRVDEAVRRILRAKAALGLESNRLVNLNTLNSAFGTPKFKAEAQDIADRGITLLRDEPKILPLDSTKPLRVLLLIVSGDPDPFPAVPLEDEIRPRVGSLQVVRVDSSFVRASTVQLPSPDTYDVAVAAVFVRVADRKGSVGLPDDEAALLNKLLGTGKPTIVACLGSPYLVGRFPNAKTWIAGFGTQDAVQRAIVRAIFGQIAIGGKIPVTVPGAAKLGDGLRVAANPMTLQATLPATATRLKPAFDLLDRAVADHAFPGGVLAVGQHDQLLIHPFGRLTYDAKSPAVNADTIYDVASLTKPIVTTAAIIVLASQGRVDLDAPVSRYLPEWLSGPNLAWRKQVAVRDLLLHDSGLPAHREYFKTAKNSREVLQRVFAEPLVSEPGTKVEYSDLGFILLGEIVKRLTGKTLAEFAREEIFAPLGINHSQFNPPRSLRARIAPTENDAAFRKRQLQGEVDDSNAFVMGGIAGHAGLFTTANDVAIFAQMMLNGGIYSHQRIFPRSLINEFTERQEIGDSARTLGWDVPTKNSSSGQYFSPRAYGHNGFTGTSIWIDPEKDLFVILLTNRVYPSAANEKIKQVRPALHDAILTALGLASGRAAGQ